MLEDILFYLGFQLGIKVFINAIWQNKMSPNVECVGQVSRIVIFPAKSMRGLDIDTGICTQRGLKLKDSSVFDRNFMVVSEIGMYISGRAYPVLASLQVEVSGNEVTISSKGHGQLKLSATPQKSNMVKSATVCGERVEGEDCGEEAARWISALLNKPGLRILYGAEGLRQRELSARDNVWVEGTRPGDQVTFADGFPLMLLSTASLTDLRMRCPPHCDVIMDQFRPNIVVTGCRPFDEDNWSDIWIGSTKFSNVKPCKRCIFTTIDPRVGKKDEQMEPLRTLRKYRLLVPEFGESPCFGVNLVVNTPGREIHVGDPVYVLRKQ